MTRQVVVELRQDDCRRLLETAPLGGRNGFRFRQLYGAGVLVHSVDEELVVEVGPRGVASRAHVSDHLALLDAGSSADAARDPGQVQVLGLESFAVAQHHIVAICVGTAGDAHRTVAGGQHGCADGRCVVDATMRHGSLEQRVVSLQIEV